MSTPLLPNAPVPKLVPQYLADALLITLGSPHYTLPQSSPNTHRLLDDTCIKKGHRHVFLCLGQTHGAYEGMRKLIQDPRYWEIEEEHFQTVNTAVYNYHQESNPYIRWEDISSSPPLSVLRHRWLRQREETIQQKKLVYGRRMHDHMPEPGFSTLKQSSKQVQSEPSLRRSTRLANLRLRQRGLVVSEEKKTLTSKKGHEKSQPPRISSGRVTKKVLNEKRIKTRR